MTNRSETTVLVVDDDVAFADLTQSFLERVNETFSISVLTDSTEVLPFIEENAVDCVVCDYEMPVYDGLTVLEQIRNVSEVPFILFTGRGSEEIASTALSSGATDYLQKGSSQSEFEVLANRIENYVGQYRMANERRRLWDEKRQFLDRVTDGFFSLNKEFEFTHLNEEGLRMLSEASDYQYSYDEVVGESLWDIVVPEFGEAFEHEYRKALEEKSERGFEAEYEEQGMWFRVRIFPAEDGASVFVYDITDKKKRENQRQEEIDLLFNLYDTAAESSLESEDRVSRALRYGREYLDVSFAFLTRIADGEQRIMLSENSVKNPALEKGSVCPIEKSYCQTVLDADSMVAVTNAGDGEVIPQAAYETFELESYISERVMSGGDVYGTLCFADFAERNTEFSEREKAICEVLSAWVGYEIERELNHEELAEQNKRLETQNKQLDAFAGFISHDLRNPLSIAMGFLDIEREQRDSENLDKIHSAHERMDEMISELLELSRSSESLSDFEETSLDELAEKAWETVKTKESTLIVEDSVSIRGDCGKLLNVFENIFRNSIEHNDEPVVVTVGSIDNGFYIEDDGRGLDDDAVLFEYGSSGSSGGHGLGLLIAHEVVKAHGWTLHAVTDTDGARFEVHM